MTNMDSIKLTGRVALQDILIVLMYWLLACSFEKATAYLSNALAMVIMILLWGVTFFMLFYSNAELFKKVKNDILWSLSSGGVSLSILVPVAIISVHRPCF